MPMQGHYSCRQKWCLGEKLRHQQLHTPIAACWLQWCHLGSSPHDPIWDTPLSTLPCFHDCEPVQACSSRCRELASLPPTRSSQGTGG